MKKLIFFLLLAVMVGIRAQAQILQEVTYNNLITSGTEQAIYTTQYGNDVCFRTTLTNGYSYQFFGVNKLIPAKNPNYQYNDKLYTQLFFIEFEGGEWELVNIVENRSGKMEPKVFASGNGDIPENFLNAEFFTYDLKKDQVFMRMQEDDGGIEITLLQSPTLLHDLAKACLTADK